MKYFSTLVVLLAVTLPSCKKPDKPDLPPKTPAYILVSYTASTYDLRRRPSPAKYDFQFGRVLIHTECWYVGPVSCWSVTDPYLPIGVPLDIKRTEQEFLEYDDATGMCCITAWSDRGQFAIRFKVLGEETG